MSFDELFDELDELNDLLNDGPEDSPDGSAAFLEEVQKRTGDLCAIASKLTTADVDAEFTEESEGDNGEENEETVQ